MNPLPDLTASAAELETIEQLLATAEGAEKERLLRENGQRRDVLRARLAPPAPAPAKPAPAKPAPPPK